MANVKLKSRTYKGAMTVELTVDGPDYLRSAGLLEARILKLIETILNRVTKAMRKDAAYDYRSIPQISSSIKQVPVTTIANTQTGSVGSDNPLAGMMEWGTGIFAGNAPYWPNPSRFQKWIDKLGKNRAYNPIVTKKNPKTGRMKKMPKYDGPLTPYLATRAIARKGGTEGRRHMTREFKSYSEGFPVEVAAEVEALIEGNL